MWGPILCHAEYLDVPKPLIEGVSYPATPQWNIDRPYLTGQHLFQVFLFYWNLNSHPITTLILLIALLQNYYL
jgi:hypothetical protein